MGKNQLLTAEKGDISRTIDLVPRDQFISRRRRILEKLRVTTILVGAVTLGTWLLVGSKSGCFDFENGHGNCFIGWLWGGGGEVFPLAPFLKDDKKSWRFDEITPSEKLDWKPCEGSMLCARLSVPLDYKKPHGAKAAIALVKQPALLPSAIHKPSILINPGGPGGSGVNIVINAGSSLQFLVGLDHSIIGFDPRGVNNTTPEFNCFQDNFIARKIFQDRQMSTLINTTTDSLPEHFAAAYGFAKQCAQMEGGADGIGRHMNTPVVARDMLSIVEAEQNEAGLNPTEGKLWYWGFSYGSVLGTTFAALFPNRVGRLIVDGVVDVQDYYAGSWSSNLDDTEKVMDSFYYYCSKAGPEGCKFHTGSSPSDVRKRFVDLLENLRHNPLIVYNNTKTGMPEVYKYADLKRAIFTSLYFPLQSFKDLAEIFYELENGNADRAVSTLREIIECDCHISSRPWDNPEVTAGIACGDSGGGNIDIGKYRHYVNKMLEISPTIGDLWAQVPLFCNGWDIPQAWPFKGPFVGNTSFPLLFISNTADPVTPRKNSLKMMQGYKDAVLLTQNSEGHCSLSSPSLCTFQYVYEYFNSGTLPEPDTICEVDMKPFLGQTTASTLRVTSKEEKQKLQTLKNLGDDFARMKKVSLGRLV